jgi:D-alanyl-D-alanine carboxypeptidase/D-alanyl-D-alanine-endopeptidase (penicillin-binding protein 4)
LKINQIKKIQGTLLVDTSDFDELTQGPGWIWDEGVSFWNSPMDALTVNHSCIDLWVGSGAAHTKPPLLFVYPKTSYVTIQNQAQTVTHCQDALKVGRASKENRIEIKGEIALSSKPLFYQVPLESPHLYTAHLFLDLLKRHGIECSTLVSSKETPIEAVELASHFSPPLSVLVRNMMKSSDNMAANCLFKKLGQIRYGAPGSWSKGGQAIRDFLQTQADINTGDMVVLDGCGQSRYNLVSVHQMVGFLLWMNQQFKISPEFMAALPLSGVDGTLKLRLKEEEVKGRVRAKTGTMTGISALAGYVVGREGEIFAFALFTNGFTQPSNEVKTQLEDRICSLLAQFAR